MLGFGPEGWLMLLATGLYLYDSALLLEPDEFVLRQSLLGRWLPRFGALRWRLRGREPYIPSPFLPSLGLIRLRWRPQDVLDIPAIASPRTSANNAKAAPADPESSSMQRTQARRSPPPQRPAAPSPFNQSVVTALWVVIFVGLPLALWWQPMALRTLVTLISIYVLCGLCAWRLFRAGVPALRKHALELLACPPFAVNLVRKLSLAQSASLSLAQIHAALGETERETLRLQLKERIQDMLEAEPEATQRTILLQQVQQHLETALNPEYADAS
jgi:hypothetical protein